MSWQGGQGTHLGSPTLGLGGFEVACSCLWVRLSLVWCWAPHGCGVLVVAVKPTLAWLDEQLRGGMGWVLTWEGLSPLLC